jgi:glucose-fructose oxidoreductase
MHMGDLLRLVVDHPDAEVVGVWHSDRAVPTEVLGRLNLPADLIFDRWEECLERSHPTAAVVCAPPASHAEWTERIAQRGLDLLVEKPMAGCLADADRMIVAMQQAGRQLAINWPLAWYPVHRTAKRLIDEGQIGNVINIHYYDGNRGPVGHKMDKIEVTGDELLREKQTSWFYQPQAGGGALLDYLGYGTTLAAWFDGGRRPIEVAAMVDRPPGLQVEEHSVTIARYESGLYKFETRWGTFTDPWTHQPQPKCGFVICGSEGTISSYDFEPTVTLQSRAHPEGQRVAVDPLQPPHTDPITYFLHCLDTAQAIEGPLSPVTSRIGQQVVDTALRSSQQKQTLPLIDR